mgnify:CR=1 FL=1
MKLLLTSAGITNTSIAKALFDLVGKEPKDTSLVFIPTAANAEQGDKNWLIEDLVNLQKLGLKSIDITDIALNDEMLWKSKLVVADILFFKGGDEYYLMEWINKSGLAVLLPELLKTKVFVGVSAGSMVTNKDLPTAISQIVYEEDFDKKENVPALNFVDFYFLPHLNSPYFKSVREDIIRKATVGMIEKIYALDDNSALKIIDGKVEIVSEGIWFGINI